MSNTNNARSTPRAYTGRGSRQPNNRNRQIGVGDIDQSCLASYTPADGFTLNANLRYLPYRSFPLFVGQLDEIRAQANDYRMRVLTIPYNFNVPIGAYTEFTTIQSVTPGSVVYGLGFGVLDGEVTDFEVQIVDVCSNIPFFSEPIGAAALRPTGLTDTYPVLLEPRCVAGDGQTGLEVYITNKAAVAQRCQLLIYMAEPCWVQGPGIAAYPENPAQYGPGGTTPL